MPPWGGAGGSTATTTSPVRRLSAGRRHAHRKQLVLAFDAFQPVRSSGLERKSLSTLGEFTGHRGDERLIRCSLGHDSGRDVDRHAPDLLVSQDDLAAVDARPDGDADRRRGLDQREGATDRLLRAVEQG